MRLLSVKENHFGLLGFTNTDRHPVILILGLLRFAIAALLMDIIVLFLFVYLQGLFELTKLTLVKYSIKINKRS